MPRMYVLCALLSCLLLTACGQPRTWGKVDAAFTPADEIAKDRRECEFEGDKAAAPLIAGNEIAWAGAQVGVVESCMRARGYSH
jgi:hypothetical protein